MPGKNAFFHPVPRPRSGFDFPNIKEGLPMAVHAVHGDDREEGIRILLFDDPFQLLQLMFMNDTI